MALKTDVRLVLVATYISMCFGFTIAEDSIYDPLSTPKSQNLETIDSIVKDTVRNRDIPLRVYLPIEKTPAPVILFSHGLGGSREGNPYLGQHWSARGYVVVFLQHAGSDEALSTAFWDAWLRENVSAREWLDGTGPSSLLEQTDRWQHK